MSYLLDTNAVINLLNGEPTVIERLKKHKPSDFSLSSIVWFEFCYGAEKSRRRMENLAKLEKLPFEILPFTVEDAQMAGQIRVLLEQAGTPIGAYDMLIAAQSITRDLTLITHNTKEFERITMLRWEDWQI